MPPQVERYPGFQTVEEKVQAIASVLFLLEEYFGMLSMGRIGSCIRYPRILAYSPPARANSEEGWVVRKRQMERAFRLDRVADALEYLYEVSPVRAQAVRCRYIDLPPSIFVDPQNGPRWALEGLFIMARSKPLKNVDIPKFGISPLRLRSLDKQRKVLEYRQDSWSYNRIARTLHMSKRDVMAICKKYLEEQCPTTV